MYEIWTRKTFWQTIFRAILWHKVSPSAQLLTLREAQKRPGEWGAPTITLGWHSAFLHVEEDHIPQLQKLACLFPRALMGRKNACPSRIGTSNLTGSISHMTIISTALNTLWKKPSCLTSRAARKRLRTARLTNYSLKIFRLLEHWHDFAKLAKSSYL